MFCLTGSCTSAVGETIPLCLKGQILPFRCLCSPPINFGMSWAHASKSKIWLIISACFGILRVPYKCKILWFSAKEQRKRKPPGDTVRENHIELLFKTKKKKRRKIKKNNWDSFQNWFHCKPRTRAHISYLHDLFLDFGELRAIGSGRSFEGIIENVLPPIFPGF